MKIIRALKKDSYGRALLNIGCGFVTHHAWNNIDFSPYARLAGRDALAIWLHRIGLLSDLRFQRLQRIDPDIISWDLRRGLPFDDNVFDVVYHSHFIAHVSRQAADYITAEVYRVLKPGGVHRVVTNDFEHLVHLYSDAVEMIKSGNRQDGLQQHEAFMSELFELIAHEEPYGTRQQKPAVRFLERLFRDPESTGERRKWYYDQYSMEALLHEAGFADITIAGPRESRVEGWNNFGLDLNPDGTVYKERSFWIEGIKPN